MKTKKIGSAGRYGTRYGLKLRKKITSIEKKQRKKQECPYCLKKQVKRISFGIYKCKSCHTKFTNKAYYVGR